MGSVPARTTAVKTGPRQRVRSDRGANGTSAVARVTKRRDRHVLQEVDGLCLRRYGHTELAPRVRPPRMVPNRPTARRARARGFDGREVPGRKPSGMRPHPHMCICTAPNTPRSAKAPRTRRHDAAEMDSCRTLSLSKYGAVAGSSSTNGRKPLMAAPTEESGPTTLASLEEERRG